MVMVKESHQNNNNIADHEDSMEPSMADVMNVPDPELPDRLDSMRQKPGAGTAENESATATATGTGTGSMLGASATNIDENFGDYLRLIVDFILKEDRYRRKLLNISNLKNSIQFEQAFPKRFATESFQYLASGSYAKVYRHEFVAPPTTTQPQSQQPKHHHQFAVNYLNNNKTTTGTAAAEDNVQNHQSQSQPPPTETTIIKMIEVYAENLLKNLTGTITRSSVSTYKDAYNEFRISVTLSYLNDGVRYQNLGYQCPLFPNVNGCYLIRTANLPDYFQGNSSRSKTSKRLDFRKLLENDKYGDSDDSNRNGDGPDDSAKHRDHYASRPMLRDVDLIEPETATIIMEDCGKSLHDQMANYKPIEILSVTKQLLMGFVVAEAAFQFEHRDLHLGNILVKATDEETLIFVFENRFLKMDSQGLLVKVIDTTFSRLKIKNHIHHRNLSHLFDDKDFDHTAGSKNPLLHQTDTYQAMASEIKKDWLGFYPRSNMVWLIYLIRKFYKILKKQPNKTSDSHQVQSILKHYIASLFKMKDMKQFFESTLMRPSLNRLSPILLISYSTFTTTTTNDSSNNNNNNHKRTTTTTNKKNNADSCSTTTGTPPTTPYSI